MTAYNKLTGTSSAVSPLLKSLVIGEWGFDGMLCTDAWGPQVLVDDQMAYTNLPAAMAAIIKGGDGADPAGPGRRAPGGDDRVLAAA